jgi:hypothetical protein
MFQGRRQLIIYHFMFDPGWEDGCPSCTAGTDELSQGFLNHLHSRDTSYALVSRAPLAKLNRWKAARGWDLPWCSSFGTDFNYDFRVTLDASAGAGEYNFRSKAEFEALGSDFFNSEQPFEMPGRSCFLQVDGRVFHTYSQYARGLESTGGPTTSSTSRRSAARRHGSARLVGASRRDLQCPTSRPDPRFGHSRRWLTGVAHLLTGRALRRKVSAFSRLVPGLRTAPAAASAHLTS